MARHTDELPAVLPHMIQVTGVTGVRVPVSGSDDTSPAQLLGLFIREIVLVPLTSAKDT
jgi:hypothetical protein